MTEFIVRARAAPVDPAAFRASFGKGEGVEYLADILRAALFISQGHREDVTVHLVLEKSRDYSRVVTFSGNQLGSLADLHERALLSAIAQALEAGRSLGKDESASDSRGVMVQATSFEHLVRTAAKQKPVYVLDPGGIDIRDLEVGPEAVFVMTDHTPMPRNTFKSMVRQGVEKVSLGPVVLHASQGIAIVLNELDRR